MIDDKETLSVMEYLRDKDDLDKWVLNVEVSNAASGGMNGMRKAYTNVWIDETRIGGKAHIRLTILGQTAIDNHKAGL